jgi:hypothetical protein
MKKVNQMNEVRYRLQGDNKLVATNRNDQRQQGYQ